MPRTAATTILNAIIESTVDITLRSGTLFKFSFGRALAIANGNYTPQILKVSELVENIGNPVNRVSVVLGNVNLAWGVSAAFPLHNLDMATAWIRVFLEDISNPAITEHRHYFKGQIVQATADEQTVSFDVIPKTAANGTRFAIETLSPNRGWKFPGGFRQSPPGAGNNEGGSVGGGVIQPGENFGNTREYNLN